MEVTRYSSSSAPKIERKFVEKNRRNQMKTLYSTLGSLLPSHNSKEVLALPDQIDEAVNYIKSLQSKLEKSQEKKKILTSRKRDHACITSTGIMSGTKSPQIEIHKMGPNLDIVLINGLENPSSFYEIIRVLHEEGAEVLHANFSTTGNSIFHILHERIGDPKFMSIEANTCISKRLNGLIHGSSSNSSFDVESQLDIWDFEF